RMGGVIGGDEVDGAVFKSLDERDPVFVGAQRGIHFAIGIVVADTFVGEGEVVGGGFGGAAHAALFGAAEDVDRVSGADMLHVDVAAGEGGEDDVSGNDDIFGGFGPAFESETGGPEALVHDGVFGQRFVLAMVHDDEIEHFRVFDGAAHDLVVLDAFSVVGDSDDAGFAEGADGGE